jgi:hypothetical protein
MEQTLASRSLALFGFPGLRSEIRGRPARTLSSIGSMSCVATDLVPALHLPITSIGTVIVLGGMQALLLQA